MIAAAGMTRVPIELQYENTAGDNRVAQIMQSMAGEAGLRCQAVADGAGHGDRALYEW